MTGGVGNQLFIYAFYRSCQLSGKNAVVDLSWYNNVNDSTHADYHLDIFDTKIKGYVVNPHIDKVRHFLRRRKVDQFLSRVHFLRKYAEKEPGTYDPHFLQIEDGYLTGTWQSEKYFKPYSAQIKQELTYTGLWSDKNRIYKEQMKDTESISVHVRRGDYLKASHLYGNICTENYYREAIARIDSMLKDTPSTKYFVFSDDIEWCKTTLFNNVNNVVYVEGNDGKTSYMDLILMSKCKHHILANSSFSWWGEWLSDNNGITIAPQKWLNTSETKDVWREGWIKV